MVTITLVVGDWSNDGHGQTSEHSFDVNVGDRLELQDLHVCGSMILGLKLTDECEDYEDSILSSAFINALKNHIPLEELQQILENTNLDDDVWIHSEIFANLYMRIAKIANPNLEYTSVKSPSINIGGYGVFN